MRVGFITRLLWSRYGDVWTRLVTGAGADVVLPDPERVERALADPRIESIPGVAFQVAAAEAIALGNTDLIVAPDPNVGSESARGSGQDPWVASFPDTLATTLAGLPAVTAVPTEFGDRTDSIAIRALVDMTPDPATARRIWDRIRSSARLTPPKPPRWTRTPDETATVGLVAQPWLLDDEIVRRVRRNGEHIVSQASFEPQTLRDEGMRVDDKLPPSDLEAVGAARLFGRKGGIDRIVLLVDPSSGADLQLQTRIERLGHKAVEVRHLDELVGRSEFAALGR